VQQFEKICSAQAWTTKAGTEKSGNLKKKLAQNVEFFIIWRFP
jgi:hypothetical protein